MDTNNILLVLFFFILIILLHRYQHKIFNFIDTYTDGNIEQIKNTPPPQKRQKSSKNKTNKRNIPQKPSIDNISQYSINSDGPDDEKFTEPSISVDLENESLLKSLESTHSV